MIFPALVIIAASCTLIAVGRSERSSFLRRFDTAAGVGMLVVGAALVVRSFVS